MSLFEETVSPSIVIPVGGQAEYTLKQDIIEGGNILVYLDASGGSGGLQFVAGTPSTVYAEGKAQVVYDGHRSFAFYKDGTTYTELKKLVYYGRKQRVYNFSEDKSIFDAGRVVTIQKNITFASGESTARCYLGNEELFNLFGSNDVTKIHIMSIIADDGVRTGPSVVDHNLLSISGLNYTLIRSTINSYSIPFDRGYFDAYIPKHGSYAPEFIRITAFVENE